MLQQIRERHPAGLRRVASQELVVRVADDGNHVVATIGGVRADLAEEFGRSHGEQAWRDFVVRPDAVVLGVVTTEGVLKPRVVSGEILVLRGAVLADVGQGQEQPFLCHRLGRGEELIGPDAFPRGSAVAELVVKCAELLDAVIGDAGVCGECTDEAFTGDAAGRAATALGDVGVTCLPGDGAFARQVAAWLAAAIHFPRVLVKVPQ